MKSLLALFGVTYTVSVACLILIPYFRRRRYLFTSWNMFVAGLGNFVGISTFQSGMGQFHLYGTIEPADYVRFMVGATVFTLSGVLTYKFFSLPALLGRVRLQKWVVPTRPALLSLGVVASFFTVTTIAVVQVQFLGQVLWAAGLYGSIIACTCVFVAWYRQPGNLPLLLFTGFTFLTALAFLLAATFSRRDYLNLILVIPITSYWAFYRYRTPLRVFGQMSVIAAIGFLLIGGVSVLRFMSREQGNPIVVAVKQIQMLPKLALEGNASDSLLGGDTTDASLAAIHRFTHDAEPYPFFTVQYVATNWIPRAWYPNKLVALAETLPRDIGVWTKTGYINLGPGVVGHGYHEGGLVMLVFYGVLIASAFRFFDELLIRQHGNVFLWAIFASVSGQIFALPRGELGLMMVLILGGVAVGLTLNAVGRRVFGTVDYRLLNHAPSRESHHSESETHAAAWREPAQRGHAA